MTNVLLLGSGPNVVDCRTWPRGAFDVIVAINNAWAVRPDWDVLIFPEDFPPERRPVDLRPDQRFVTAEEFVPAQNDYGGFVFAGGTMAFTAVYWALSALRPRSIACLGCDMVYPRNRATHFYGTGAPDPLRKDISLRSLEAKSARALALAARQGCALVNLSTGPSRLTYPRLAPRSIGRAQPAAMNAAAIDAALAAEAEAGYVVPSGRYWLEEDRFDTDVIDRIDALWHATLPRELAA